MANQPPVGSTFRPRSFRHHAKSWVPAMLDERLVKHGAVAKKATHCEAVGNRCCTVGETNRPSIRHQAKFGHFLAAKGPLVAAP